MRRTAKPTTLLLALLLGACASSERQFQDNAAEANFKLGIGYMQSGHLEVAAEKLLKALQYDDDYPEAHNALGVLYEEMREYSPATDHYQRAISLKPDYTLANLRTEYRLGQYALFTEIKNLANTRYYYADGLLGPPLTWLAGIGWKI